MVSHVRPRVRRVHLRQRASRSSPAGHRRRRRRSSVAVAALGLGPDDLPLVGELPQGLPSFSLPDIGWSEWTQLRRGGRRGRVRGLRGRQRPLADVRHPVRPRGRSEPGTRRARGHQRRGRPVHGLPRHEQPDANTGRRVRGGTHAAHRGVRGPRRRRDHPGRAGRLRQSAEQRAGGRRHECGAATGRNPRGRAPGEGPPERVHPVDGGLRLGGGPRAGPRRRRGDRVLAPLLHAAGLATAHDRAGSGRRHEGLPQHRAPPRGTTGPGTPAVPVRRAAVLRQRRASSYRTSCAASTRHPTRSVGSSSPPSR